MRHEEHEEHEEHDGGKKRRHSHKSLCDSRSCQSMTKSPSLSLPVLGDELSSILLIIISTHQSYLCQFPVTTDFLKSHCPFSSKITVRFSE
jgi:hypothetical protein